MKLSLRLLSLLVSIGVIVGILSFQLFPSQTTSQTSALQVIRSIPRFSIPTKPVYPVVSDPVELRIPVLDIDVRIEAVGLDSQGRMNIPKNVYQAGWYEPGARPGDIGQAVLDGHINTPQLTPSIFYNLHRLEQGDTIEIIDTKGTVWEFEVERTAVYDNDRFPIELVFGKKDGRFLNLITCSGIWDRSEQSFSQRTVVFSKLVSAIPQQ